MGQEKEMSFLDHLEELRWHVIKASGAIIIAAIVAFLAKGFLFDVLIFGPTKADFFTYEFLCNTSRILGFESFCNTNFQSESRAARIKADWAKCYSTTKAIQAADDAGGFSKLNSKSDA